MFVASDGRLSGVLETIVGWGKLLFSYKEKGDYWGYIRRGSCCRGTKADKGWNY